MATPIRIGGREGTAGKGIVLCRAATTAALATNTLSGNKLTATANAALASQDGIALAVGDYLLVKNEAEGKKNGVYKVLSLGSAGSKYELERVPEMDTSEEARPGMLITVAEGTRNEDRTYSLTTNATITLNTTALTFALISPKDFGLVSELPTSKALVGDLCTYKADNTNGVFWQFVYDGEGEYPWKCIGGSALSAETEENKTGLTSTTYAELGPAVTAPLKGDYMVTTGALLATSAQGFSALLSYAIGGTGAAEADAINYAPGWGGHQTRIKKKTGFAAATALTLKYRVTGGNGNFGFRFISILPIRCG